MVNSIWTNETILRFSRYTLPSLHQYNNKLFFKNFAAVANIGDKIKANTGIAIIRRLYNYLPRNASLQVYKSFLRPNLDYCDVIYHKPSYDDFSKEYYSEIAPTDPMKINAQFTNKLEYVQNLHWL